MIPLGMQQFFRNKTHQHLETRVKFVGDDNVYSFSVEGELIQDIVRGWGSDIGKTYVDIEEVNIGSFIISIGTQAFLNCSNLSSVMIPDSVTSIGYQAFNTCSALTNVTIGTGVMSIGDMTFARCYVLTSVTIPTGVISIGHFAFANCHNLMSVKIPRSVNSIGYRAFYDCNSLILTFQNRTLADVQTIENYPWGLNESQIQVSS